MIEFIQESLSPALETKLRRWINLPEADILRRVIIAECQLAQAAALSKALEASPGDPKDLLLQDDMKQATRFAVFLDIFNTAAARDRNLPFQIAKLKPATTYANTNDRSDEDSGS